MRSLPTPLRALAPRSTIFLFAAIAFLSTSAAAQAPVPPPDTPVNCRAPKLTPEADFVANEIGVRDQIDRLTATECSGQPGAELQSLLLRQKITERVLTASLDVDAVLAQIDYERAQILETRTELTNQQSHTINLLSMANIVAGTGSGILSNAMQFSDRTASAGDAIGIGGGTAGVLLSILGLRVQGPKGDIGIAPNMLAEVLDRSPEVHSVYPAEIWNYLNSVPPAYPRLRVSWRQELTERWQHQKRIGPPEAPASQARIQLLTSSIAEHKRLPVNVLMDRSMMLLDVRARVGLMKGALRDLIEALSDSGPEQQIQ